MTASFGRVPFGRDVRQAGVGATRYIFTVDLTTAVPKLVYGLTRGLFCADIERHWASFKAYDVPQAAVARQTPATGEER